MLWAEEYMIVRNAYAGYLALEIDKEIKKGWQPIGGVSFCERDSEYVQAMVKYRPIKEQGA